MAPAGGPFIWEPVDSQAVLGTVRLINWINWGVLSPVTWLKSAPEGLGISLPVCLRDEHMDVFP